MGHPCDDVGLSKTVNGNKLRHALLHSRWLHVVLLTLLVVDALICIFSGVLESQFFEGTAKDLTKYICSKNTNKDAAGTPEFGCRPPLAHHRRLTSSNEFEEFVLASMEENGATRPRYLSAAVAGGHANASGNSSGGHAAAGAHGPPRSESLCYTDIQHDHNFGNHDLHTAEIMLAKISAAILCFFLLEQLVLITELKTEYLKPMFVLDLFVISSSLAVEMLLITNAWGVGASSGLLVIARVWRFARVGHGMLAGTDEVEEIIEKDSSIDSMESMWAKLTDERWKEIKKSKKDMTAAELEATLTKEEKELVEELAKTPAVALRALAFAKSFKKLHDKKMERKGLMAIDSHYTKEASAV